MYSILYKEYYLTRFNHQKTLLNCDFTRWSRLRESSQPRLGGFTELVFNLFRENPQASEGIFSVLEVGAMWLFLGCVFLLVITKP